MKILTVILLLSLSYGAFTQASSAQVHEQRSFTRVERVGDPNARSFFVFETSARSYTIRNDGYTESFSATVLRRFFNLKMGQNGNMERVYFLEHEGDLLLLYEVGDARYGWGYLTRLDQTARKPRWVTPVSGFNIGPGVVEGGFAYVTAANMLAKIDLRNGSTVWQQAELEKKYAPAFYEFRLPSLTRERVLFPENGQAARSIEVDKASGEIVNVRQQAHNLMEP